MPNFQFRRSSYSDDKDECVEVATNVRTTIAIRDSKTPSSPSLHVHPTTWETFRTAVTDDRMH